MPLHWILGHLPLDMDPMSILTFNFPYRLISSSLVFGASVGLEVYMWLWYVVVWWYGLKAEGEGEGAI